MPGLTNSLRVFEIDQLEQVAQHWDLQTSESEKSSLLLTLELAIPQPDQFSKIFNRLPDAARQALTALKQNQGKLLWSTFAQRFGEIRSLGKRQRKKEQPWVFPTSSSELLWYHGLIGRDFLRIDGELQEMAYLPDELVPLVPNPQHQLAMLTLKPLSLPTDPVVSAANWAILDESCLLLAALRFEDPQAYLTKTAVPASKWSLLAALLQASAVLNREKQPTELARKFLQLPRGQALRWLANQWIRSDAFDEVHYLPGLRIETDQPIRSKSARRTIIDLLTRLQPGQWYALDELIEALKHNNPDFLRQQEDYFSWTILRKANPLEVLSGFESWSSVEGELITFVVLQILPLLGLADIGIVADPQKQSVFRLKEIFFNLDDPTIVDQTEHENEPISVTSTGKIIMTDRSPRIVRYQISRFTEWLKVSTAQGTYQINPTSLQKANEQGLLPKHLIQLLRKHAETGLPPILYQAIKSWETEGTQADIQTQTILRLGTPEILQALRASSAAHWLGESLGPAAVVLKPGAEKAVVKALSALGYLTDYNESENQDG
ncbi:MAG: helicase-associated domain-containing protein [Anaerolineaceae bacterium]|nr:helicase-associated domain-containing protein [Anaerolineaceae bacterium]